MKSEFEKFSMLIFYVKWFKVASQEHKQSLIKLKENFVQLSSPNIWIDQRDWFMLLDKYEPVVFYIVMREHQWLQDLVMQ